LEKVKEAKLAKTDHNDVEKIPTKRGTKES
jgi:hypothetical protein